MEDEMESKILQDTVAKVVALFNGDSMDQIVELYAPDARMVTEHGSVYNGAKEIAEALGRKNNANRGVKADVDSPTFRAISPDVSIVEVSFRKSVGEGDMPSQGKIVAIAKKSGERWQIDSSWVVPLSS
jgi:ketosteroid isomerase-like protein